VARVLPVADGVLKHQLYVRLDEAMVVYGRPVRQNDAVFTFWTHKAGGGSPVSGARITAEQDGIAAWCALASVRLIFADTDLLYEVRTWDYGLDPAPRTVRLLGTGIAGSGTAEVGHPYVNRVVAMRSEAVGSVVRNRLNGRLYHPLTHATAAAVKTEYDRLKNTYLNPAGDAARGNWVLVSWRAGGAIRTPPLVVGIDHLIVDRIGVQRRRNVHYPPYRRGA